MIGSVVADTLAFIWYILGSNRLSAAALAALEDAVAGGHRVYLPAISLVEIWYLSSGADFPARYSSARSARWTIRQPG